MKNDILEFICRVVISASLLSLTLQWNISTIDWIIWGAFGVVLLLWISNTSIFAKNTLGEEK